MKNILITGGAGYIGSHISYLLIDKGYNVTIIDNLVTGDKKIIPSKAKFFKTDIANKKKIKQIITRNKFDCVIHLAGLVSVEESVLKPKKYLNYNYEKAKIFLNLCFKNNLKKIIFSSTALVYGNSKNKIINENFALKPSNPYAKSKLKLENFLIRTKDINYIILRYFNVAGAEVKLRTGLISKHSTHLIKKASETSIYNKKRLIINGNDYNTNDGTAVRDYIHVADLAEIHLKSLIYLEKSRSNIFNCGYGIGYSVLDVINTYNNILKNKISYIFGPRRIGDIGFLVSNPNKLKKCLTWKPKFNNLKLILKTALLWEKKLKTLK